MRHDAHVYVHGHVLVLMTVVEFHLLRRRRIILPILLLLLLLLFLILLLILWTATGKSK